MLEIQGNQITVEREVKKPMLPKARKKVKLGTAYH